MSNYDATFFEYVSAGAVRSARVMLPLLTQQLPIRSVLDVGCGQGAWLSVWSELGVQNLLGIDGDYVDRERLLVAKEQFLPRNLRHGFELGRRFDLVQSLEVAEHLPAASAPGFVNALVAHGGLILFSAAPKGQGGDHHVNEQGYDYWRRLFALHGYVAIDYLRPRVLRRTEIEPWYRYNPILYASSERFAILPPALRAARLPDDRPIPDLSPPLYKVRKAVVRLLPVAVMTRIAKLKEQRVAG